MPSSSNLSSRKRKYSGRGGGNNNNNKSGRGRPTTTSASSYSSRTNPKRGGPGILFTCETTREVKCQREGLEILEYYLQSMNRGNDDDDDKDNRGVAATALPSTVVDNDDDDNKNTKPSPSSSVPLSLEEELKQLKSKASKGGNYNYDNNGNKSSFGVYDTGCRGSVFVICTLPNCELIEPIQTEYQKAKILAEQQQKNDDDMTNDRTKAATTTTNDEESESNNKNNNNDQDVPTKKKPKIDKVSTKETSVIATPWDPIATVDAILADRTSGKSNVGIPSSRFITRIIPIQATCFASEEELRLTCENLLPKYLPKDTKTFAIVMKRRNCERLKRDAIIDIIANIVVGLVPKCKAQMDKPEITITVEICRTLCGISVVKNYDQYKNFNLFSLTEHSGVDSCSSSTKNNHE
ncbi:THUMP domain containing protein [Nitzschia inconspicua]|uniref:THUMP domain containing protein n=1 Tax=Nitzschia inconspicua TaxID=303405 RepID=A0A9K3LA27_9STRA|nr:THUMP domain containing protein [Nitzschia inconspicua]KAG7358307.1 THUMP domain containing protein [Nitzschia inconspicua]